MVPRYGEELNSFGLLQCPYWSIVRMWLLYWEIYHPFIAMRLFWELWWLFCCGFEEDRPKDSEKWSWVKNEVMSVVCGAMFGEERVNNSVDLLSRALVTFLVEDFVYNCHTFAATCCYRRLNVIGCAITHASLAFFSFERNQWTLHWFCTHCGPMFI